MQTTHHLLIQTTHPLLASHRVYHVTIMCDKANITKSTCWCTNQIKCLVLRTWHISNQVIYKLKKFQMVSLCYLSLQGLQSHNSYCQFGRLKVRLVATVRSEFDCEHCHVLCSHTLKGMLIFCDGVCTSRHCLVYYIWFLYLRVWFCWFRYKNHHSKYNTPDNMNSVIFNLLWIVWQSHTSSSTFMVLCIGYYLNWVK